MNDSKIVLGAIPSPVDIRDYKLKHDAAAAANFPDRYECGNLPEVLNQGSTGSCVAHTLAAIISWHMNRQTAVSAKMSILGIYGNRANTSYKNVGMVVRDAIKAIKSDGDPLYTTFPGNPEVPDAITQFEAAKDSFVDEAYEHHITGMISLDSADDIKTALMNYGPVAFVVNWYSDFKYKGGILNSENRSATSGAHCMMIYGWATDTDGTQYWRIQNSWGTGWGNKGRALIPMDMPLVEAWGILDDYVEGAEEKIEKPWSNVIAQCFAKIINIIINWFRSKS